MLLCPPNLFDRSFSTQKFISTDAYLYTHIPSNFLLLYLELNANRTLWSRREKKKKIKISNATLPLSHISLLIFQVLCEVLSSRLKDSLWNKKSFLRKTSTKYIIRMEEEKLGFHSKKGTEMILISSSSPWEMCNCDRQNACSWLLQFNHTTSSEQ